METTLRSINSLIQVYLDEMEKSLHMLNPNLAEINQLKLELSKLEENKNKEINEYISRFSSQPDFYVKYGTLIKKDLEQVYKTQEKELIDKLNQLTNQNISEFEILKQELIKKLVSKHSQLKLNLQSEEMLLDRVIRDLTLFKFEYNEFNKIINFEIWKNLIERNNKIRDNIEDIKECLKYIEDCLNVLMFNEKEIKNCVEKEDNKNENKFISSLSTSDDIAIQDLNKYYIKAKEVDTQETVKRIA